MLVELLQVSMQNYLLTCLAQPLQMWDDKDLDDFPIWKEGMDEVEGNEAVDREGPFRHPMFLSRDYL